MEFNELNISSRLLRAVDDAGYKEPSLIQQKAIPSIIDGNDVIAVSKTGSGKTASFALPLIDKIDFSLNQKLPQVIVVCPTRELAMQVTDEFRKFAKYFEELRVVPIYGGVHIEKQMQQLRRGCRIIVGTPGRLCDHIRRRTIKCDLVKAVVLDESDEMLNMGFRPDIESILSGMPEDRQTVMFSATMPKAIVDIAQQYQHDAVKIKIESKIKTVTATKQYFFTSARGRKPETLVMVLKYYAPESAVVFCNTKKTTEEVTDILRNYGISCEFLHGDIEQKNRTKIMNAFKAKKFTVLVATDVAARGIDVEHLSLVINFDLPRDDEYYVHRIGRTGRAGNSGTAFSIITGKQQMARLREIMKYTGSKVDEKPLPMEYDDLKFVAKSEMSMNITDDDDSTKRPQNSRSHNRRKPGASDRHKNGKSNGKSNYHGENKSSKAPNKTSKGKSDRPQNPGGKKAKSHKYTGGDFDPYAQTKHKSYSGNKSRSSAKSTDFEPSKRDDAPNPNRYKKRSSSSTDSKHPRSNYGKGSSAHKASYGKNAKSRKKTKH